MTNKEFIEYLGITGELDLNNTVFKNEIDNITKSDIYLGDAYLKFKKLDVSNGNILMFLDLILEKTKRKDVLELLESWIKLIGRYKFYVNDNITRYTSSILRDILLFEGLDKEYFLNKSIVINPKKIVVNSRIYNIDTYSEKIKENKFRWFLRIRDKDEVDVILCKDGKHQFIKFENDDQITNLRKLVSSNKDYDLLLVGYYTASYKETEERVRKILKGVIYE